MTHRVSALVLLVGILGVPQSSYRARQKNKFNGHRPRSRISLPADSKPGAGCRASEYTLYGGNGKAGAPSYDFARLRPGMDISQLPQMVRGPIEELKPEEPQVPWSERHWYVITAGLIAAVGLMLWIIIPGLKREIANDNK